MDDAEVVGSALVAVLFVAMAAGFVWSALRQAGHRAVIFSAISVIGGFALAWVAGAILHSEQLMLVGVILVFAPIYAIPAFLLFRWLRDQGYIR